MKNKKQIASILIFLVVSQFIISCTNPVEIATNRMYQTVDSILGDDINFLIACSPFMCHNADDNYWYSEDVTYREMFDDDFKQGLRGLIKLQKRVGYIESYAITQDIFDAAIELEKAIKKEKKELKKAMHSKRQLDFMFGDIGGFGTMLSFGEALDSDYNVDDEFIPLDKNIQVAKTKLYNLILSYKQTFQSNIETLYFDSFDDEVLDKLNAKQILELTDSAYNITLQAFYNNNLNYNEYDCLDVVAEYFFKRE